jgi:hypothetical protein
MVIRSHDFSNGILDNGLENVPNPHSLANAMVVSNAFAA